MILLIPLTARRRETATKERREEGKEIKPFKEQGMQLAAYRRGVDAPEGTRLINIFVSRNDPDFEVQPYEWEEEAPLMEMFDACLTFWKAIKGCEGVLWILKYLIISHQFSILKSCSESVLNITDLGMNN